MGGDPDWGRFGIKPPNTFQKVGDPTRWGAADSTNIVENSIQESSAQILQLVTRDPYARPWSIIGTLSMPVSVWTTAQMIASIFMVQGVGQIQLTQEIALWIGTGSAGGPGGLCYQQDSLNGGPYITTPTFFVNVRGTQVVYETRAFAIIGGLVGQSIAVRARYGIITAPNPDLPAPAVLSLIANPIAAGTGL